MSKLTDIFGRKGGELAPRNGKHGHGDGLPITLESYSDTGARMGEENEALRNLLFDTGRKIGELDELKAAFDKIVAPFNNTLRALEQEKSISLSLNGQLAETRAAYDALRTQFYQIEKKATLLDSENNRLREDLELTRETARTLESHRNELNGQISNQHAQIDELDRQLAQESGQRRALAENRTVLSGQLDAAEKHLVELEGELAAARERVTLLENETKTAQVSIDHSLAEISRLTRRLTESENLLTSTRGQLAKTEAGAAESQAECIRLSAALDEAREQHHSERNTLTMKVDALQSRATTAEKLLGETRQNLIARTEEARAFDRKATEASIARNTAEKRIAQIETAHDARERAVKDLEQSRTTLVERVNALTKTLKSRESALSRAEERVQSLTERGGHLEADLQVARSSVEKRVEDLNASLQRERMERAVVEGALEAARKDNSRLQSEVSMMRAALRRGAPVETAEAAPAEEEAAAQASPAPKPRKSKAAATGSGENVEPIVKS
jgi:crescentin